MADIPDDQQSEPCEKCSAPVVGYVAEYCCDGRECGCMGRPVEPCWCTKCWDEYDADAKRRSAEFAKAPGLSLAEMLEDLEHEEDPRE